MLFYTTLNLPKQIQAYTMDHMPLLSARLTSIKQQYMYNVCELTFGRPLARQTRTAYSQQTKGQGFTFKGTFSVLPDEETAISY